MDTLVELSFGATEVLPIGGPTQSAGFVPSMLTEAQALDKRTLCRRPWFIRAFGDLPEC
jgi:hypothetical protein